MLQKMKGLLKKDHQKATSEESYSRFGIGYRLISAFAIVTFLTIVISVVGWISFDVLTSAQNKTAERDVPAITLALKLANDASTIAALAPQLGASPTEEERKLHNQELNVAIKTANERVNELSSYVADEEALHTIIADLQALVPIVDKLNSSVTDRLRLSDLRHARLKQLQDFRGILQKGIGPLQIPVRLKMFETMDGWEELLEESIEQAQQGVKPEYDTDDLRQGALDAMVGQEAIFSVQSSGFLLISLLAEGALAEDQATVKTLSESFLSSISSMATPLAKISEGDTKKFTAPLEKLFSDLLIIGTKGTDDQVIFKIRATELQSIEDAKNYMAESHVVAGKLTKDVSEFVTAAEASINQSNLDNQALAEKTKMTLLIAAIVSVLVAALIGWLYIARSLIKRLLMMVDSARKLSEGDLEASIYRNGNDELARLGHALVGFRNTAREAKKAREEQEVRRAKREEEKEQQRQEQIEKDRLAAEEKERLTQEAEEEKRAQLNQLADEFEGSVKTLVDSFSAATTDMRNISGSMTSSAGETTSLTQTVASASEISSNSINSVAAAAEELSSSISEISRQVGQAAGIAGEAVSEAERSNVMITGLNDAAAKIGDVVSLISDIAEQTNLLALNATIEAARAGDAGKGFAVVASEVKNLATQTAKATEEITNQIKAVQQETGNAVLVIGGISSTIGRINEINTTISAAVEEQGAATSEISRSVQQAASSANEVSQNINTVNQTASKTGASATEVQQVAERLSSEAGNLEVEVERFIKQVRGG